MLALTGCAACAEAGNGEPGTEVVAWLKMVFACGSLSTHDFAERLGDMTTILEQPWFVRDLPKGARDMNVQYQALTEARHSDPKFRDLAAALSIELRPAAAGAVGTHVGAANAPVATAAAQAARPGAAAGGAHIGAAQAPVAAAAAQRDGAAEAAERDVSSAGADQVLRSVAVVASSGAEQHGQPHEGAPTRDAAVTDAQAGVSAAPDPPSADGNAASTADERATHAEADSGDRRHEQRAAAFTQHDRAPPSSSCATGDGGAALGAQAEGSRAPPVDKGESWAKWWDGGVRPALQNLPTRLFHAHKSAHAS